MNPKMRRPLEDIGFYTLSDARARTASVHSPLWRCELLVTDQCNFKCPYCRGTPADARVSYEDALKALEIWQECSVRNVRFSGGEPTLVPWLPCLVRRAVSGGARVAISTNGSASREVYARLLDAGVTDFSVSLDACCASGAARMSGGRAGWARLISNIAYLASAVYTTVGIVVDGTTVKDLPDIIKLAYQLKVHDIRIISAAQWDGRLLKESIDQEILEVYPILRYRVEGQLLGAPVRGLDDTDSSFCFLALDDMAVRGNMHYPCIIYMREGGVPIGKLDHDVRKQRARWAQLHNPHGDPICRRNCLDVCVAYNNRFREFRT